MIFILDVILIISLSISYRRFRCLVSPPFLVSGGMLIASLVASIYYEEWQMSEMSLEAVMLLGGATLFFTILCVFQKKSYKHLIIQECKLNLDRIKVFLYFLIFMGLIASMGKLLVYMSTFGGNLHVSDLIWAAREDYTYGSNKLSIPIYVKFPSILNNLCSYFTAWLLAIQLKTTNKKKPLLILLIIQLFTVCVDGVLSGTKGGLIDPIFRVIIFYFLFSFIYKDRVRLSKSKAIKLVVVIVLLVVGFKGIDKMMGRDLGDVKSSSLLAAYCGAEIKNFDTYIQNPSKFPDNKFWGENSFSTHYINIGKKNSDDFQDYQYCEDFYLGNVYTQYFSYHKDWGVFGVFMMMIIISIISMSFYNNAIDIKSIYVPTISVLMYGTLANHLFMSFFSSRFTEYVFQFGFIKILIYLFILIKLFHVYFIKRL